MKVTRHTLSLVVAAGLSLSLAGNALAADPWEWWPNAAEDLSSGEPVTIDYGPRMDPPSKKWEICVLLPHLKDTWWVGIAAGAMQEAARQGIRVDFQLLSGEVHVLFGESGAGKSTLINVMAGIYPADAGTYRFCGDSLSNIDPHRARRVGISPVFQEFSLAPYLTIEENLFLGREVSRGGILNKREMRARVAEVLDDLGFELSPRARVADLSRARQQI